MRGVERDEKLDEDLLRRVDEGVGLESARALLVEYLRWLDTEEDCTERVEPIAVRLTDPPRLIEEVCDTRGIEELREELRLPSLDDIPGELTGLLLEERLLLDDGVLVEEDSGDGMLIARSSRGSCRDSGSVHPAS